MQRWVDLNFKLAFAVRGLRRIDMHRNRQDFSSGSIVFDKL